MKTPDTNHVRVRGARLKREQRLGPRHDGRHAGRLVDDTGSGVVASLEEGLRVHGEGSARDGGGPPWDVDRVVAERDPVLQLLHGGRVVAEVARAVGQLEVGRAVLTAR